MSLWNKNTKVKVIYNETAGYIRGYIPVFRRPYLKQLKKFYVSKQPRRVIIGKINDRLNNIGVQSIDFCFSKNSEQALIEAKRLVVENYDVAIVVGGDGTLNQIINGIAESNVALGILPMGTVNSIALSLGISLSLDKALDTIINGNIEKLDLGKANGRYFASTVGIGFDAHIVADIEKAGWKKRIGVFAYVLSIIKSLYRYKFVKIDVDFVEENERLEGVGVIVNTLRYYAGEFQLSKEKHKKGYFDVFIFQGERSLDYLKFILKMCRGVIHTEKKVLFRRSKKLKVSSAHECFYHTDGDLAGSLPLELEVFPNVLNVISSRT